MNRPNIFEDLNNQGMLKVYWEYEKKIDPAFFYRPHGIHGLEHTRRVLLLSQILAAQAGLKDQEKEFLAVVSLLHDIGRTNDKVDPGHGRLGFLKAKELGLLELYPGLDPEMLRYVIEMHCIDDQKAFGLVGRYDTDQDQAVKMLRFFKDADGLDRVRVLDLDPNQLRTPAAEGLVGFAEELYRSPGKVMDNLTT